MRKITPTDDSASHKVLVRKYKTAGRKHDTIAISIPKVLHQTINGISVRDRKSRSKVIAELIRAGLERKEQE